MTAPAWEHPVRTTLTAIALLGPDWDSYGARTIDPWCIDVVPELLLRITTKDTPAPHVVPLGGGGIGLEWHTAGVDLEVEVLPERRLTVLWDPGDNLRIEVWEQDYGDDLSRLRGFVAQIK